MKRIAFYIGLFSVGLFGTLAWRLWPELTRPTHLDPAFQIPSPFELASLPVATRFDFPLGSEHGALTYNAQHFTENHHLGDDLNGIGGENSDLGDPIYAVADGRVLLARDGGPGWGGVIIVLHAMEENGTRRYVQSYYGHCQEILVHFGDDVRRGQKIATVGTAGVNILPICISKCASSLRHSSDQVIGRILPDGSILPSSSPNIAGHQRMTWGEQ